MTAPPGSAPGHSPGSARTVAVAVIPARLASVRFPEKMLASETGRPLVAHACERAAAAATVSRVVVATDSDRIARAVEAAGFAAVMTSPDHPNGTSRINEAADALALPDDQIIVNVQGDEPELDPALIDAAVSALLTPIAGREPDCATIASPVRTDEDAADPNVVKVVRRADGAAMYFSRARIPFDRDGDAPESARPLRHVGLYVYRRAFLRRYAATAPTALETAEKLEQLRILESGGVIAVAVRDSAHAGIDTPAQYKAFVQRWMVGKA